MPDLPGLGESHPLETLDVSTVTGWLEELIRMTTDEPPTLVAHSLLGVFAARFAMKRGDHLERLVLVDTPGLGPFRPKPRLVAALLGSMLRPGPATLERLMRQVLFDLQQIRNEEGDRWGALMGYLVSLATRPDVKKTMRRLPKGNLKTIPVAELRTVKIPVTLIWGEHDPNTRRGTAEKAREQLSWPLHVIERAGHIPHAEQPDAFIDALRSAMADS